MTNQPSTRPPEERRALLTVGVALIVAGAAFLAAPRLGIDLAAVGWPLFVLVPGILLFVLALAVGGQPGAGIAVAGGIVTMTGLVLAFQNATGLWATWAYAWALVAPGGVAVGLLAYGVLTRQAEFVAAGRGLVLVAAALFAGFGLFFEGLIGLSGSRLLGGAALPALLVVVGAILVVASVSGRGRRT